MAAPEVDELFEVRPAEFVRRRDEIVAALKSAGREDAAAEVKSMRRPTVTVWALNQMPRRERANVHRLLTAGERLRDAQEAGSASRLRAADDELQDAASRLATKGAELVVAEGVAASGREDELRVALRSAALDPEVGGVFRAGRLEAVPEIPVGAQMWAVGDGEGGHARGEADGRARVEEARRRADQAREEAARADRAAARAAARAEELRARLQQAQVDERAARKRAEEARQKAEEAARELDRAAHRAQARGSA